ncbi:hypothetical protein LCGC14_1032320 [marine sediment metagenome]|uniref:Uncharacterized protein n=1 Tax=marine sediment metagenome TaxID=412755 RepID=A0A0F9QCC6_9ZZZZ
MQAEIIRKWWVIYDREKRKPANMQTFDGFPYFAEGDMDAESRVQRNKNIAIWGAIIMAIAFTFVGGIIVSFILGLLMFIGVTVMGASTANPNLRFDYIYQHLSKKFIKN